MSTADKILSGKGLSERSKSRKQQKMAKQRRTEYDRDEITDSSDVDEGNDDQAPSTPEPEVDHLAEEMPSSSVDSERMPPSSMEELGGFHGYSDTPHNEAFDEQYFDASDGSENAESSSSGQPQFDFLRRLNKTTFYPDCRVSVGAVFLLLLGVFVRYNILWRCLLELFSIIDLIAPHPYLSWIAGSKPSLQKKIFNGKPEDAIAKFASCSCSLDSGTYKASEFATYSQCKKCKCGGVGVYFYLKGHVERVAKMMQLEVKRKTKIVTLSVRWFFDGFTPYGKNTWLLVCRFPGIAIKFLSMVWVGSGHPANWVLRPFVFDLQEMYTTGFKLNSGLIVKVRSDLAILDSPARALVLDQKDHGGYYCCPFCMIPGERSTDGKKTVYPNGVYEPRTNETWRAAAKLARETGEWQEGLKDWACVLDIPGFDPTRDCPVEPMHNLYLGIVRYLLLNIWYNTKSAHYVANFRNIDKFIDRSKSQSTGISFFPEAFIGDRCNVSNWNAQHLETFLLCHGPIVLRHVLPADEAALFEDLRDIALLCLDMNPDVDLIRIKTHAWCENYENLFLKDFMTLNVHLFWHMSECIEKHGPPCLFSAHPFENFIGVTNRSLQSPNEVAMQTANRIAVVNFVHQVPPEFLQNENARSLLDHFLHYSNTMATTARTFVLGDKLGVLFGLMKRSSSGPNGPENIESSNLATWPKARKVLSKDLSVVYRAEDVVCCGNNNYYRLTAIYGFASRQEVQPSSGPAVILMGEVDDESDVFIDIFQHDIFPCYVFGADGLTLALRTPNFVECRDIN